MRAFKKVWAEFANPQTGHLERSQFVPFFRKLSGVFEVRIYPAQYNIRNIAAAQSTLTNDQPWPMPYNTNVVGGLDINKLNNVLDGIDYTAIRKRRAIYNRLYHEATIAHQQGRGILFTDMLLLLAHHKLIKDSEALVLRDLVIHTETNKLVTDLVNLDRVQSLLKMISLRQRFLAHLERKCAESSEIPAIVVDTMPETLPPLPSPTLSPLRPSSRDISTVGFSGSDNSAPSTSTPMRRSNFGSIQLDFGALGFNGSQFAQQQSSPSFSSRDSFTLTNTSLSLPAGAAMMARGSPSLKRNIANTGATGLHRSNRRTSGMSQISRLSTDLGYRYPRDSIGDEDPSILLEGMQNSIWGDLMEEVMNEAEGH
ncbi:hypothetical protein FB446DRAFT_726705 [Lentinula raphanica]|nr:hypothetical protein FB446DRAFT_726705 [Lentinula raphanica]